MIFQIFSTNDLLKYNVFILGFECLECKILHWIFVHQDLKVAIYQKLFIMYTHSTGLYIFN